MKTNSFVSNKILLRCTIFLAFLCIYTPNASAQDTEYWFVAPDVSYQHGICDRPAFIMITTGSEAARVTISMPKNSGFPDQTQDIAPNSYWQYSFGQYFYTYDVDVIENADAGNVGDKGVHIKSESGPISVYYQVDGGCSKDIFTLKGSKALGQEFYTPFQTAYNRASVYSDVYGQIHIVATEDNTTVNITPPCDIVGGAANVTKTITLQRGETFFVRELTQHSGPSELIGTHITSDKDIAVTVADDALESDGSYDLTGDQLVPVNNLGTSYVVIKGFSDGATDNVYILATEDNTEVYLDGSESSSATLNKGETFRYDMGNINTDPHVLYIRTSNPAYCYQQSAVGKEMGAALIPSMYSIASKKIVFYKQKNIENDVLMKSYLFLVFRTNTAGGFLVNGSALSVTPENVPGLTEWQYAKADITDISEGACTVENTEGVFAVGYFRGEATASALYAFLSSFGQLEFPETTYKCVGETLVLDAGYAKSYKWWKGTLLNEPEEGSPLVLSTASTYTVPVNDEGHYSVRVDQDPYNVVATTEIIMDAYKGEAAVPKYAKKGSATSLSVSVNRPIGKAYSWTIDGGTPATATDQTVSGIVWGNVGTYNVDLTIKNTDLHCQDTLIQNKVMVYDIQDDYAYVIKNQSIVVDVLNNDDFSVFTAYPYTIEIVSNGTYGEASVVDNMLKYAQTAGYTANVDRVVYQVKYNGDIIDQATVYITTTSLLIVVKESGNDAAEPDMQGKFTIKYEDGGFSFGQALKIYYSIDGTAECGIDYDKPADYDDGTNVGFVIMPANAQSVPLNIIPKNNHIVEGTRTIEVGIIGVEEL